MKKKLVLGLTCVAVMFLVACGAKEEAASNGNNTSAKPSTEASTGNTSQTEGNTADTNPVEKLFLPATSSATGAYATIKVSSEVKMDDESAWLGLCPAGKDYITELEADEVDVTYYYADVREAESDPYVFACDFSYVEDGTYALVVNTSDDENVGYVAIQLEMTKNGEELSFDYTNAQLKERPAK